MEELQSAYQIEQQQLKKIAAEIENQLNHLEKVPRYTGENITEQALEDIRERTRQSLRMARNEPYFGRLDFQEDGEKSPKPIYIGKSGVAENNGAEPLVTDWRAPISSLFYSFSGGEDEAYYQSPEGLIEGDIQLKRNIAIRNQKLQRVVDTYVKGSNNETATDEFLLYRLGENKDHRLRDIVSTIQAEQNDIIRTEKNIPLIIQGVAGSGKTTVALHRLAYLIYEYRENLKPEKMIIFAPNAMFLDYISNVLPELGVGGIQQTTFTEWSMKLLDDSFQVEDTSNKLHNRFLLEKTDQTEILQQHEAFKGSIIFKNLLDNALNLYEQLAVPTKDFHAWNGAVLSLDKIKAWYTDLNRDPLAKRRERIKSRMKTWITNELKKIPERHLQKELRKISGQHLRSYLKSWPEHSALSFYQSLFNEKKPPKYVPDDFFLSLPDGLAEATFYHCKKKCLSQEDLAPLVYIHQRLNGIERQDEFHHTVLDEAQDFSPFQMSILNEMTRNQSFTILGDLSQGIHGEQGISSWKEFQDVFKGKAGYFELKKSYRSTMEIIEFANQVLAAGTEPITLAEPVFRSGKAVEVTKISKEQRFVTIMEAIAIFDQESAETLAIVGRTDEECLDLYNELNKQGIAVHLITAGQQGYEGGVSIVPVYLTKGLEFDVVLIIDVDASHYRKTARDAKLLYVGCTRALHELHIYYSGKISPLIMS